MASGVFHMRARLVLPLCAILLSVHLASCREDGDYLAVAGGGFIFNYRIAEATYGIALKPMRELPADAVVEATLENPAGGEPIVMRKKGPFNRRGYRSRRRRCRASSKASRTRSS